MVGVAGSQNYVAPEVDIELLFERSFHVDFGEHAKALFFEGGRGSFNRCLVGNFERSPKTICVSHLLD